MRDLLYKNLTSTDRTRKVITSSEITDKQGVHSVVRRHFACRIKQIDSLEAPNPSPYLYVIKERNTKQKREHFFCKLKGNVLTKNNEKLFLVTFVHTLNIELTASDNKLSAQLG